MVHEKDGVSPSHAKKGPHEEAGPQVKTAENRKRGSRLWKRPYQPDRGGHVIRRSWLLYHRRWQRPFYPKRQIA
jgi:hypothetical protein